MRTIAIINQKGGCGKTTTSINLAACLARLGQKTLLVDVDPQGHCAVGLAVPEEQIERTIFDALIEDRDGKPLRVADIVWQIATDFDLAPSNIQLAAFEQLFAGRIGRDDRLKSALAPVQNSYQWCIVDCPPSVGLITFNALRACDEVIVPVETGYFSLHGLAKMMETLEVLREKCGKEILIRVLPTLYDTRTKLAREVLSELRGKFKEYLMDSTVNFNTKLKEAASFGQPITEYDPGSRGYKDFVNLARELMGHRPAELEPTPMEKLSRPQELVQRAKQLAQLTNLQFGKNLITSPQATAPTIAAPSETKESPMESVAAALARGESKFGGRLGDNVRMTDSVRLGEGSHLGGGSNLGEAARVTAGARGIETGNVNEIELPDANGSLSENGGYLSGNDRFGGSEPLTQSARLNNPTSGPSELLSSQEEESADNIAGGGETINFNGNGVAGNSIMTSNGMLYASGHINGNAVASGFSIASVPVILPPPAVVLSSAVTPLSAVTPPPLPATVNAAAPVKSTAQKIDEFYGVKQVGDEVIFATKFEKAKKVLIAGDFNNWSPMSTPMIRRSALGDFETCLPLRPGRYRYRLVVDGKWMTDPHNSYVETNQFGELNNVVDVD